MNVATDGAVPLLLSSATAEKTVVAVQSGGPENVREELENLLAALFTRLTVLTPTFGGLRVMATHPPVTHVAPRRSAGPGSSPVRCNDSRGDTSDRGLSM